MPAGLVVAAGSLRKPLQERYMRTAFAPARFTCGSDALMLSGEKGSPSATAVSSLDGAAADWAAPNAARRRSAASAAGRRCLSVRVKAAVDVSALLTGRTSPCTGA